MKAQTGAQQHRDHRSPARPGTSTALPSPPAKGLSERQQQVLECLQKAGTGLTAKQIQARISCAPCAAADALAELVGMQLVVRLNTLVPSYTCRHSDPLAHAE